MIYAYQQNDQANQLNQVLDSCELLNKTVKSKLNVGSHCHFSTLVSNLSRYDQERCYQARLWYQRSELCIMANYIELKLLNKTFRCGNEVIFDFIIQRVQ